MQRTTAAATEERIGAGGYNTWQSAGSDLQRKLQKWTCSVCTFSNEGSDAKCTMCEAEKEPKAPTAADTPVAKKRKFEQESASPKKKPTGCPLFSIISGADAAASE